MTGYQIFYTTTAVEDLDTWQTISVPVTTSADMINLEKNSQYAVAVCAKTKTGLGRLSAVVDNVKIKPEDVPLHLTAEDLSTHSMTLRWSRPVRLNPIEYRVRCTVQHSTLLFLFFFLLNFSLISSYILASRLPMTRSKNSLTLMA